MVAVAASAFAIDAFYGQMKPLITNRPRFKTCPTCLKILTSRKAVISGTLGSGFSINIAKRGQEIGELFGRRDEIVHPKFAFHPTLPHPSGTNVSTVEAKFALEAAEEAVTALIGLVSDCLERPKREFAQLVKNSGQLLPAAHRLRQRGKRLGLPV